MPEKKTVSTMKQYWLPVFMAASIAYVVYYLYGQLGGVADGIRLSATPLLAGLVFQVCFWILSSYLWSLALFAVSGKKVGLADSFFQLCLVNLGKYIPGKIWGMLARASYINQRHELNAARAIQATYIEQIYLLGAGAVTAFMIAAILWSNLYMWLVLPLLSLLIIAALVYQKPLAYLVEMMRRIRGSTSEQGVERYNLPFSRLVFMFLMYILVWVLLGMVMYCLYVAMFDREMSLDMILLVILSCIAGMSAGFVAIFAPGGIGVREAVSGSFLVAHMSLHDVLLLVLVFRIWLAVLEVTMGGILYLLNRKHISGTAG